MMTIYLVGCVIAYFLAFVVLRDEVGLGTAIFAAPFLALFYPIIAPVVLWTWLDEKYPEKNKIDRFWK